MKGRIATLLILMGGLATTLLFAPKRAVADGQIFQCIQCHASCAPGDSVCNSNCDNGPLCSVPPSYVNRLK